MSSFKGSYQYTVDDKSRINIPSKMRKYISREAKNTFTITRGFETCIFMYPNDEWLKLETTIRKLISTDPKHRFFTRTLLQWATEAELDTQSRITLPKELLQFAHIENEILIIGVLERIELWNPKLFKEYERKQKETYENVAATVFQSLKE